MVQTYWLKRTLSDSNVLNVEKKKSYVVTCAKQQAANILVPAASQDREQMAEVIVTFKIMPKDADTNMDKLEEKIKVLVKPERIKREPIAFGLVAINVTKLIPDASGELELVENKLKSIEGIGQIEVTETTRSL